MPKQSALDRLEAINAVAWDDELEAAAQRARRGRLTDSDKALITVAVKRGVPLVLIAKKLGKNAGLIGSYARKNNLKMEV